MIIQHNMQAMNGNRMLGNSTRTLRRTTEKLSSGYRINRAADDAAGLAISEKMRGQIRGLDRSVENVEDGISLVQTADGAMAEIEDMVHRMRELSVQAANDTNTMEDREEIQQEINQLSQEITRISDTTEFNTRKILKGRIENVPVSEHTVVVYEEHSAVPVYFNDDQNNSMVCGQKYYMANTGSTITLDDGTDISTENICMIDFSKITSSSDWKKLDEAGFTFVCSLGCKQEFTFVFDSSTTDIIDKTPNAIISNGGISNNKVFQVGTKGYTNGATFITDLIDFVKNIDGSQTNVNVGHDNRIGSIGDKLVIYGSLPGWGDDGYLIVGKPVVSIVNDTYEEVFQRTQLRIQAGANGGQELRIELPDISLERMGIEELNVTDHENASLSIDRCTNSINYLNSERSRMGAYQNRMEHTVLSNENTSENLQASESRIRDADMATEMAEYSKYNILQQAGESVLAQANQVTQGVLSLLQ